MEIGVKVARPVAGTSSFANGYLRHGRAARLDPKQQPAVTAEGATRERAGLMRGPTCLHASDCSPAQHNRDRTQDLPLVHALAPKKQPSVLDVAAHCNQHLEYQGYRI
jgi:hypothetical protein